MNEKGSAAIILCAAVAVLFAVAAYVTDIGMVYIERTKLSNAIDSAVLAAALELPNDAQKARDTAASYLQKNNVDTGSSVITVSSDNKSIYIESVKDVKHLFAPVFGIKQSRIKEHSKGIVAPIRSLNGGVRPFAVEYFNYTYGNQIVLKNGAGAGYNGNYNAISLGGTGASNFENNALYGFKGTISVGDYIDTETGDMSGATNDIANYINSEQSTFTNYPRGSIRLWTIPMVNTMMVNGKKQVLVKGFGQFFVEAVKKNSGKIEITGRFVKYVTKGEIDTSITDMGTYGVKLVE
ncbi:MAG: Tad domain-containing protein [Bacillota bacterium]|nr:Tad domain-containing protein [Bacillota bacterium]